jgi:hypothetical protein
VASEAFSPIPTASHKVSEDVNVSLPDHLGFGSDDRLGQGTNIMATVFLRDDIFGPPLTVVPAVGPPQSGLVKGSDLTIDQVVVVEKYVRSSVDRLKASSPGIRLVGQIEVCDKTGSLHGHFVMKFPGNKRLLNVQKLVSTSFYVPHVHTLLVTNLAAATAYATKQDTKYIMPDGHPIMISEGLEVIKPTHQGKRNDVRDVLAFCDAQIAEGLRDVTIMLGVAKQWPAQYIQFTNQILQHLARVRATQLYSIGRLTTLNANQKRWWDLYIGDDGLGGSTPRNDRIVQFIVGGTGGEGKSCFINHVMSMFPEKAITLSGELANMQAYFVSWGLNPTVVFIDQTRASSCDLFAGYATMIEMLKSGRVTSGKYVPAQAVCDKPHVIVFCNDLPLGIKDPLPTKRGDVFLFSADRVRIERCYANGGPVFERCVPTLKAEAPLVFESVGEGL